MDEKTKAVFETWASDKYSGFTVKGEDVEELYQAFKNRFIEDFFSKAPEPDPANPYGGDVVNFASENYPSAKKIIKTWNEAIVKGQIFEVFISDFNEIMKALIAAEKILLQVDGIKWDALEGGIETGDYGAIMKRIPFDEIAKWFKDWGFDEH